MGLTLMQVSSLKKVRQNDAFNLPEIHRASVLAGERFCYQICMKSDKLLDYKISAESELKDYLKLYSLKNVIMDMPAPFTENSEEDYITLEPGLMPDVLVPLSDLDHVMTVSAHTSSLWIRLDVPEDTKPGIYDIHIKITPYHRISAGIYQQEETFIEKTFTIQVIPAVMPQQNLIYTRWFYADCIAVQHNVTIYSEEHWDLIDQYIAAAADVGINMILVPVHTPPLDTAIGTARPCVQLVDIQKNGDTYEFSFEKFHRFISICKKNGIKYFEIAHMFSQWGAKCAPNIMVTENGKTDYLFGWHVSSDAPEYVAFLKQYIQAIAKELEKEGISDVTYFHISDEPHLDQFDSYKKAYDIIRPLIGSSKTMDALSDYAFYEKGLVECPIPVVSSVHDFTDHDIENLWTYYCCSPTTVYPNGFMAMPSRRIRILGFLLYKYNIKGFLHWGYNFYFSSISRYAINPYLTTSSDMAHSSGDAFIVYPAKDGVYSSIRGEIQYNAIQDMRVCYALEELIGRDAVVEMIDTFAGCDLRFDDYPKNDAFLENLRAAITEKIGSILVN